tara:strand:- start:391 stop:561 length:171 start_codon:yes stop_codon:yes gene_type:complete
LSKQEEGLKRSKYYSSRYDHYISMGYSNGQSSKLAHVDLAKQFKQKNPTIDKLKQI